MSALPLPDDEVEIIDLTASDTEPNATHQNGVEGDYSGSEEEEYIDEDYGDGTAPSSSGLTARVLQSVLATVPESRLRKVTARLANRIPDARALLVHDLVALDAETREPIPRWETCSQCEQEMDMSEVREEGECRFHPGKWFKICLATQQLTLSINQVTLHQSRMALMIALRPRTQLPHQPPPHS
jgi:hypothetical protein